VRRYLRRGVTTAATSTSERVVWVLNLLDALEPSPAMFAGSCVFVEAHAFLVREIEKFIMRQPPKGEKDDSDSENSWISDGLPSSSRRRRRGDDVRDSLRVALVPQIWTEAYFCSWFRAYCNLIRPVFGRL